MKNNIKTGNILRSSASHIPAGIYLLKVNNRNNKDTRKIVLVSLLLTLNIFHTFSSVSIVDFEHVMAGWDEVMSVFCQQKSIYLSFHL